jgi:hypothetical protein
MGFGVMMRLWLVLVIICLIRNKGDMYYLKLEAKLTAQSISSTFFILFQIDVFTY